MSKKNNIEALLESLNGKYYGCKYFNDRVLGQQCTLTYDLPEIGFVDITFSSEDN